MADLTPTFDRLPVLDFALIASGDEFDRTEFVRQLHLACLNVGFFLLKNLDSRIPRNVWDAVFEQSRAFFKLDRKEKDQIRMEESRHFRGFSGFLEEKTQGQVDNRGKELHDNQPSVSAEQKKTQQGPWCIEQIDFGPEVEPVVPYPPPSRDVSYLSLYGPNQFPSTSVLPGFKPAYLRYRESCEHLAQELVELIAESIAKDTSRVTSLFNSPRGYPPYARSKVTRYPPAGETLDGLQADSHGLGVGAHKDGGGLTLLMQDQVGGLEVQRWDGAWIPVPYKPYHLVVNIVRLYLFNLLTLPPWLIVPIHRGRCCQSRSSHLQRICQTDIKPAASL
jgi:isopenicillin N synthase-like dioxygenase